MKYNSALIVYVGKTHKQHTQILKDLQDEAISQQELNLPDATAGVCAIEDELVGKIAAVDVLVIYISAATKENVCIATAIATAQRLNKKVIAIWLENALPTDIGGAVGNFADSVIVYGSAFKEILDDKPTAWVNPDGSPVPKRVIKKHTCG